MILSPTKWEELSLTEFLIIKKVCVPCCVPPSKKRVSQCQNSTWSRERDFFKQTCHQELKGNHTIIICSYCSFQCTSGLPVPKDVKDVQADLTQHSSLHVMLNCRPSRVSFKLCSNVHFETYHLQKHYAKYRKTE